MQLLQRLRWEWDKAALRIRLVESIQATRQIPKGTRILFYVPEAWVVSHFAVLSLLAKTVQDLGHPVAMVRCYQLFDRCPAKDMRNLPVQTTPKMHEQICIHCAKSSFQMVNAYDLPCIDLRAYDSQALRNTLNHELNSLPESLIDYEFDGVSFGRICANQVALIRKASFLENPSEENRLVWKDYIQTALMNYLLMNECLREYRVPTMVSYNDYVPSMAARVAVRKAGGTTICVGSAMHKNVDRTRPIFYQNLGGAWLSEQHRSWNEWKDLPVAPHFIREISDDSLNNFRSHGIHIFSPNKKYFEGDLRRQLGIDTKKKIIIAFTSSLDEMLSMKQLMLSLKEPFYEPNQPFSSQIEWLHALCEYSARRSDFQLWVRIHPREGSNARNRLESEHLVELRKHFASETRARFVWPEEHLSSYDLAEMADLVLISWSTIGLEMARVGVPVIATTNNEIAPIPHGGFLQWVQGTREYFELIDRNLVSHEMTSLETIRRAFRWYYASRLGHSIDISDVMPHSDFNGQPPFRMPGRANDIVDVIVNNRPALEINRRREPTPNQSSWREETEALRQQLRRLVHYFLTGQDYASDNPRYETAEGFVSYTYDGASRKKYSPLTARLVRFLLETTP